MIEALAKLPKSYNRNKKIYALCVDTGETALLSEWARNICKTYQIEDVHRVYSRIYRAARNGDGKSFGLVWRLVENKGDSNE